MFLFVTQDKARTKGRMGCHTLYVECTVQYVINFIFCTTVAAGIFEAVFWENCPPPPMLTFAANFSLTSWKFHTPWNFRTVDLTPLKLILKVTPTTEYIFYIMPVCMYVCMYVCMCMQ